LKKMDPACDFRAKSYGLDCTPSAIVHHFGIDSLSD